MKVIGPAEAEIWLGDVNLCAHCVWDGGCASLKKHVLIPRGKLIVHVVVCM